MKYFLHFLLLCTTTITSAQSILDSIPNQKLVDNSYVSDRDTLLDPTTRSEINSIFMGLEQKTSVQVAVVMLSSIGQEDAFELSQQLFERWGIGQKENDNGLLILFAREQRIVRFHTGDGLEGVLPDVVCKRIQMQYMVPEFRNENYSAGLLAGVVEVNRILSDPVYAQEVNQLAGKAEGEISDWSAMLIFLGFIFIPLWVIIFIIKATGKRFADSKHPSHTDYPGMRLTKWGWLIQYVVVPAAIVALYGFSGMEESAAAGLSVITLYLYFLFTLFHRLWRTRRVINGLLKTQSFYEIAEFMRQQQWYWLFIAFVFPLPFIFYFFYHLARKRVYRNYPRPCKQCSGEMIKLDDVAEDEYLSAGMLLEEKIKSVDYDVWKCKSCSSIEMWHYLSRFSKYEPCPKCKTIAWYISGSRTVVSPTYSSNGKGEQTHECKFCGHKKKSTYSIAQLTRTSSNSGSSSFSSGSSSSGGSWGGGSSGGGGASSSW